MGESRSSSVYACVQGGWGGLLGESRSRSVYVGWGDYGVGGLLAEVCMCVGRGGL